MVAGFKATALGFLPPLTVQGSAEPVQLANSLVGWTGQLSNWSLRVSNMVNTLLQAGGVITNGALLIGDTATGKFDLGSLTAGTNIVITTGAGTITLAVAGILPATLTAHGVLVGEGASPIVAVGPSATVGAPLCSAGAAADPAFTTQWTFTSTLGTGNYAGATPPAGSVSPLLQLVQASGSVTSCELDAAATNNTIMAFRSEGTVASPSATTSAATILAISAQAYDNTPGRTANNAQIQLNTINIQTTTDHSSQIVLKTTPTGSTTIGVVGIFTNQGCSIQGTTLQDNAIAGFVGEYASTVVPIANEVSINAAATVATLSLTAGDWDVWGELWLDTNTGAATLSTTNGPRAGINTVAATLPTVPGDSTARTGTGVLTNVSSTTAAVYPTGPIRITIGTTTNVFLIGVAPVSAGTAFGYGKICARRRR